MNSLNKSIVTLFMVASAFADTGVFLAKKDSQECAEILATANEALLNKVTLLPFYVDTDNKLLFASWANSLDLAIVVSCDKAATSFALESSISEVPIFSLLVDVSEESKAGGIALDPSILQVLFLLEKYALNYKVPTVIHVPPTLKKADFQNLERKGFLAKVYDSSKEYVKMDKQTIIWMDASEADISTAAQKRFWAQAQADEYAIVIVPTEDFLNNVVGDVAYDPDLIATATLLSAVVEDYFEGNQEALKVYTPLSVKLVASRSKLSRKGVIIGRKKIAFYKEGFKLLP